MRKLVIAGLLSLTMIATSGLGFADSAIEYDFEQAGSGLVRVKLDDAYQEKNIKIMVAYEGQNPEFYDYNEFAEFESYGIDQGAGTYQIGIYQNTTGNSYRSIGSKSVQVDDLDPLAPYLTSLQNISWEEGDQAALLALQLTEGIERDWEKVQAIHQYLIENISYDYDKAASVQAGYLPDNALTLENGQGICYDYSSLMASMLRSLNIPAKLVMGYSNAKDVYHAWNEVYDAERQTWILIDSTYDANLYQHGYEVQMERSQDDYQVEKIY